METSNWSVFTEEEAVHCLLLLWSVSTVWTSQLFYSLELFTRDVGKIIEFIKTGRIEFFLPPQQGKSRIWRGSKWGLSEKRIPSFELSTHALHKVPTTEELTNQKAVGTPQMSGQSPALFLCFDDIRALTHLWSHKPVSYTLCHI